jgi:hypothetical protein
MTMNAETAPELVPDRLRPQDGAPNLQGYIDAIEPDRVYGWAWNSGDPSERLAVEVRQGTQLIMRLEASQLRPDLVANGVGDGRYAFTANVPAIAEINRASPITVLAISADGASTIELKQQNGPSPAVNANSAVIGEIRARDQRLQGQLRQLVSVAKEREGLGQELNERLGESLGKLDRTLPELERRMGALEVFELRFDTLLQKVDKRLAMMEARSRPKPSWRLRIWCVVATASAIGLGVHFLLSRGV